MSASPTLAFLERSLACRPVYGGSASVGLAADLLSAAGDFIQTVEVVTGDLENTLSFLEIAAGSLHVEGNQVMATVSHDKRFTRHVGAQFTSVRYPIRTLSDSLILQQE